tara:strand:- start:12748 stop:13605 length:858 start_codon:yes stop_codon:yes gene_type:complete
MAWTAFDYVFSSTDWRLQVASLKPIALLVEYADDFGVCIAGAGSWKSHDQARAWVANRVLQLASTFDKTVIRGLSLQFPTTEDGPVAEALLNNLERRIRDTVIDELVIHFDDSISEWERATQVEVARIDDSVDRWRASRFMGLDQLVSVDAARKAIRFLFSRCHWFLTEDDGQTVLNPDWHLEQIRAQRSSLDEQTRARSLVARCIEILVDDHVREQRAGMDVAPMTRLRLKTEIERSFAEKGPWGLVDLALPRDRSRHLLCAPRGLGESLRGLIADQDKRMGLR